MVENLKIAVVDDDNSVIESYKLILGIKNYDVAYFETATEFLKDFKADQYDIVFLDLYLKKDPPPYNRASKDGGVEALKKIKEIDASTEVIIVTGWGEKAKVNAITLGAMEYLSKPFVMEVIYDLVNRAERKRRDKKSKKKGKGPIGPIH
jgi:DNA-binding NtrC family response regulator